MSKQIPVSDPFDLNQFSFGKRAGDNKYHTITCPTCGKLPTHPTPDEYPWPNSQIPVEGFFMMRDELSAREYYISGMCQSCQDSVFNCTEED